MSYIGLGPASAALTSSGTANSFTNSPSMGGSLTAATDISASAGVINIATTTSSAAGVINQNSAAVFNTLGTGNLFLGNATGNFTLTTGSAIFNTGLGNGGGTLLRLTTGRFNTALGSPSAPSLDAGNGNVAVGVNTLGFLTSGNNNIAIGTDSAGNSGALPNLATGSSNIAIGPSAGSSYTTSESSNIVIAAAGTASESNVLRIGTTGSGAGQVNKCFIAGIFGVTIGGTGVAVSVDNTGQLGTVVSSKRFKENIVDIEDTSKVLTLRPVNFNFIKDSSKTKQWGLIAEEVHESYPALVVYDNDRLPYTVRYNDLPVLLLNEIKKLVKRIEVLEQNVK